MDPKIKQLRAFALACRLGSVTSAAEELHLTQSAASQLIQQLEESLGAQLFHRVGRSLSPTALAESVLPEVEDILDRVEALKLHVGTGQAGDARVSFACTPTMAAMVMAHMLDLYREKHPAWNAVLKDAPATNIVRMVVAGQVEFGFVAEVEPAPQATFTPVHNDALCVICSRRSPMARRRRVAWRDLADQAVIGLEGGSTLPRVIKTVLAQQGIEYRPAYDFTYMQTAVAMAGNGLGVVVLPAYMIEHFDGEPRVVARKLVDPVVPRSLFVVTRAGASLTPQALGFIAIVQETLGSGAMLAGHAQAR